MSEPSQVLPQALNTPLVPLLLLLVGLVLVVWTNRNRIKLAWWHFSTRRCLNNLGLEQLSDLKCPDGLGGDFLIDRLLLRHDGLSVIIQKNYPGNIFCADHIDEWTQMLGQKSFKFKNPLFELDLQVKSIADCFPGVNINGYLFFDRSASFPKGHPQRVIHPDEIPDELKRNHLHRVEPEVLAVWKKFSSHTTAS